MIIYTYYREFGVGFTVGSVKVIKETPRLYIVDGNSMAFGWRSRIRKDRKDVFSTEIDAWKALKKRIEGTIKDTQNKLEKEISNLQNINREIETLARY